MKDHEIAQLVNRLRDIAVKYHAAQQLREQIAIEVRRAIAPLLQDARRYEWLRSTCTIRELFGQDSTAFDADVDAAMKRKRK
jgi:hypothetical protein